VNIVLGAVKKCFPHLLDTPEGLARMSEMIPTWNFDPALPENAERFREIHQKTDRLLQLAAP
jgi:malate dehydrogenase (quinone)